MKRCIVVLREAPARQRPIKKTAVAAAAAAPPSFAYLEDEDEEETVPTPVPTPLPTGPTWASVVSRSIVNWADVDSDDE
jgi:hypothetical protein